MNSVALLDKIEAPAQRFADEVAGITYRGYRPVKDEIRLPTNYDGVDLPVNLVANNYCPTDRDVYLHSVGRAGNRQGTWASLSGRYYEDLLFDFHNYSKAQVTKRGKKKDNSSYDLYASLTRHYRRKIKNIISDLQALKSTHKFINDAKLQEVKPLLRKLGRFETIATCYLLDLTVARAGAPVNLSRQFAYLFPLDLRYEIDSIATDLGLTTAAKPDFIFDRRIIGDIKSGQYKEFWKITLAAYALAYESATGRDMNFGLIYHVSDKRRFNVPDHNKTMILLISNELRLAFAKQRNRKFEIFTNHSDPGLADRQRDCKNCVYFRECEKDR